MSTQPQPAPVLAWHLETAREIDALYVKANMGRCTEWPAFDTIPAIIAAHDPHAETMRLLEEANKQIAAMRATTTIDLERWSQLESLVELVDDDPTGFFISCEDFPDEPDVWICFTKFLDARIRSHLAKLKGTQ